MIVSFSILHRRFNNETIVFQIHENVIIPILCNLFNKTVSVISSDPLFKAGNSLFSAVSLKP